jgi:hypothetical protein
MAAFNPGGPVIQAGVQNEQGGLIQHGGPAPVMQPHTPQESPLSPSIGMIGNLTSGVGSSSGGSSLPAVNPVQFGKSTNNSSGGGGGITGMIEKAAIDQGVKQVATRVIPKIWGMVKGAGAGDMADAAAAAGAEEVAGGGPEDPVADVAAIGTLAYGAGSWLYHHFNH